MRSKLQCHKPYRILKQLLVPKKPWNLISVNFIEKLPVIEHLDTNNFYFIFFYFSDFTLLYFYFLLKDDEEVT